MRWGGEGEREGGGGGGKRQVSKGEVCMCSGPGLQEGMGWGGGSVGVRVTAGSSVAQLLMDMHQTCTWAECGWQLYAKGL
jgi:hypothetical protein